ncbi:hypothetical protein [Pleomorphomonas carboxyditropha]|uniref:Uncharacterized protein n=1 Tax=Pleomorphomonas carboxyditropha TaxID=2023338 RepID=A0A2G9X137_9HYPH|nr:hypothetical protein [Pleomorphomonas carboxyditropha]PIP00677.1 hypothetical protein CJ014_00810 [Pleomorphomonas carboxyditropha]
MTIGLVPSLPSSASAPVPTGHELATADVVINAADYPTLKEAFAAAAEWRGYMNGFMCRLNLEATTYTEADRVDFQAGFFPELAINGVVERDPALAAVVIAKVGVTISRDTAAEVGLPEYGRNRVFDVKIAFKDDAENTLDFSNYYTVGSRVTLRAPSLSILNTSLPLHALVVAPGVVHAVDATGVTIRHLVDQYIGEQIMTSPAVAIPFSVEDEVMGPPPSLNKWFTVFDNTSAENFYSAAPCVRIHSGSIYGIGGVWFDLNLDETTTNGRPAFEFNDITFKAYGDFPLVAYSSGEYGASIMHPMRLHRVYADQIDVMLENITGAYVTGASDLAISISGLYKSYAVETDSFIRNLSGIAFGNDGVLGNGPAVILVNGQISGNNGNAGTANDMARIFAIPRHDGVAMSSWPAVGVPAATGAAFYSY